jgi:hypothetical protein
MARQLAAHWRATGPGALDVTVSLDSELLPLQTDAFEQATKEGIGDPIEEDDEEEGNEEDVDGSTVGTGELVEALLGAGAVSSRVRSAVPLLDSVFLRFEVGDAASGGRNPVTSEGHADLLIGGSLGGHRGIIARVVALSVTAAGKVKRIAQRPTKQPGQLGDIWNGYDLFVFRARNHVYICVNNDGARSCVRVAAETWDKAWTDFFGPVSP